MGVAEGPSSPPPACRPGGLRLGAVSIDAVVRRELSHEEGFGATVCHVFRSSLNLEPHRPGRLPLISLVDAGAGNLPGAILVAGQGKLDWLSLSVKPGMEATLVGEELKIGPAIEIELAGVPLWEAHQTLPGPLARASALRSRLESVGRECAEFSSAGLGSLHRYRAELLAGEPLQDADLTPMARRAAHRIGPLLQALRSGRREEALEGAASLVGLGIGLTPSGDDLLVGLFGTFHLLSRCLRVPSGVEEVAQRLELLVPGRTSRVSEHYLLAALRGEVSESLKDFVASAVEAEPGNPFSVRRLLSYGSSSGVETALGALLAIELLLEINS